MAEMNPTALQTAKPEDKVQTSVPFHADTRKTEDSLLILLRLNKRQRVPIT